MREMIQAKQSKGWNYLEAKTAVVIDNLIGLEPKSVILVQKPKPLPVINLTNCLPKYT